MLKLDNRTREARLMEQVRAELLQHVGPMPSVTQKMLIERIVILTLHTQLFDRRALESGGLSERDSRAFLAYQNSLTRVLRQLGLRGADVQPTETLDAIADEIAAAKAQAA